MTIMTNGRICQLTLKGYSTDLILHFHKVWRLLRNNLEERMVKVEAAQDEIFCLLVINISQAPETLDATLDITQQRPLWSPSPIGIYPDDITRVISRKRPPSIPTEDIIQLFSEAENYIVTSKMIFKWWWDIGPTYIFLTSDGWWISGSQIYCLE